ncbi:nucleolar and coiled-body phosphoprotein 1-like isoform X1 [Xiphophorus maculatus]|uniref:Nucleolar and coiled-body phosphoprotein 1-like n=1 Tax=Xiphophorus maculatus TaxID=8083 RepID=M4A260_XIPMA|nr:nucleolar and coiled-body phosphoprotein 1-like isoform X1 [Xiphophorus maculatus]
MSVNASQLELNQLIYRHLKEHGFLSAAEELQRHSPQVNTVLTDIMVESKPSVSLLDIYKSWLKNPKKKRCPKSEKCSKSGEQKTPSKAKTASTRKKTDKPAKIPASPKKSVPAKRKKSDEKPSQSVKAKKSKPNTMEKASGDESDSDSSLDIEKWKKLLDQLTEVDVAKMETINALASESQPKKKRVRKPQAKPLSEADAPVQQNGETIGQNEQGIEKVGTQTPTKKNAAKRSKKESPARDSSPTMQSPNKRVKSVEDKQASSEIPEKFEKQTELQEMLVPVNAKDAMAQETKKKKKKKKEKEKNEDKIEGSANETNSDGKDSKEKRSEITEQEEAGKTEGAKRTTKEGKMEERGSDDDNISELSLQKKKAKKKEKDKSSSEEGLAQIDKKKKMMVVSEENLKQPDKIIKPGKPKKKENNNMEGNLEYVSVGEEGSGVQTIEEIENSKEIVTKEKTSSEEYSAEMHKKKAKKKKDKSVMEENLEHGTMAVEENVEDEYNSEQIGGKKKSKKKKREPLGCKEFPEEVVQEKKAKKNEKSDENDLVEEEKPKGDDDHTNNKCTLETDEGSLEVTSPLKKKKKKNKLKSDEAPEEAEISTQNASTTQSNSADVHKKKKKSKRTES